MKKDPYKDVPDNPHTLQKARKKCWEYGITIYPVPLVPSGKILKIAVNKNNQETLGDKLYDDKEIHRKMNQLYWHYYLQIMKKEQYTTEQE